MSSPYDPNNPRPVRRVRPVPIGRTGVPRGRYGGPPGRDIFPYIMGALASAGAIGLLLLVWVVATGSPTGPTAAPTRVSSAPNELPTAPRELATQDIALPPAVPTGSPPPADEAPRIALGDFKKLYDDPAKRPVVLDTRTEEAFRDGHIPGAILVPADEVVAHVRDLPKDRLIVAYCQ